MRQASVRAKSNTPSVESRQSIVIENAGSRPSKRRVFGTGGIFEKKGSRFLYISYRDMNGKLRQESTKSESLMVAENLLRDRLVKVEQGLPVAEMKKLKYEDIRKTLILDYRTRGVKMLEEDKDGNPYVWGFEHLDPFFKNRPVRTITTDLLYEFIERRQNDGAKNATINRNLSLLRRMISLARREGKLVQAPYFPMLKEDNVRKGFLTPSQFIKLRQAMPEHLRPLVTFLYFTGCRIGAALAITWSQIESEKGRFQLRIEGNQTKNEEPILLPLPLELNEILKKLPRKGKLFDARNLRKSFQAACVKVGLGVETGPEVWQYKGLLLHDFRRSGVRNLIRSGVPRRIAMKISGHVTESTFERYNIVDSTDLHEAMAKVEKYFDGNLMAVEENQQHSSQQIVSYQSKPR
ncbi:MAG: tyrosine-type recombinase/integrase [Candidatus Acidiferrum sp.]